MEKWKRRGAPDRMAGGLLVLAAGIIFIGAAIPFFSPSLSDAPWSDDRQELLDVIAGNTTAWVWANGIILVAVVITILALVPLSNRFEGPGRSWAWMGLVAFVFAAVLQVVDRIISIGPVTWAADQGVTATNTTIQAFDRLGGGLSTAFFILGFLALGLYGVAMAQNPDTSRIGWSFVVGGVLGVVLRAFGGGIPGFVFLGTGALGMANLRRDVEQGRTLPLIPATSAGAEVS